jgi:hypothetical protein
MAISLETGRQRNEVNNIREILRTSRKVNKRQSSCSPNLFAWSTKGSSKLAPGASDESFTAEDHEILWGVLGSRELSESKVSEACAEALTIGNSAEHTEQWRH